MRISDWSSDVCSSDLSVAGFDFADAAEQLVGIGRRQRLDLPQLTGDRTRAHACLGDLLLRLVELFADLVEHVAEFAEFGFDRTEHAPDLAGSLFDRQCAKAHLQAVEQIGRASCRESVCQYV